ncbi:MAG: M20/M25/M40 family metallo-hydrolase [Halioglobus sp.]
MRFATLLAASLLSATGLCAADESPLITPAMLATAGALVQRAREDNAAYAIVESLTTEVGPRLAGTEAEARARRWAVSMLTGLGFPRVRVEPFAVPLWLRGVERARIVAPFPQPLTVTALGGSASTGAGGVTGEVAVFDSLAALAAGADGSLRGRIAFIDEPMTRTQDGSGYGVAVAKRREAAYEAERLGALALLIRSVGTSSHRFAHTGQMRDAGSSDQRGVPAAALAAPDADQLRRALDRRQPVELHVTIAPEQRPPAASGNVIAEIPGRDRAAEIVLAGAHLDSWDLGTGAVDDGAGVGIVVAAAKLLLDHLPRAPRRTIRVVLFGSEEVGIIGARAYAEQHAAELADHVLAAESDFGAGDIWRFDTRVAPEALSVVAMIGQALRPLGIGPGGNDAHGGPDLAYLREAGVPIAGLIQNGWDYFDLHHTPDDTLDKIAPGALDQNVAAYAALLYLVAESEAEFR